MVTTSPFWDWWFQWKNTSQLDSKTWSSQVGWNFWTFESTSHIFSGRPSPDIPVGRFATLRRGDSQVLYHVSRKIQFHQIIYINGFKWYTTYTTYPEVAINRGIKHCWLAQTNLSIRLMFTALPDGTWRSQNSSSGKYPTLKWWFTLVSRISIIGRWKTQRGCNVCP